MTLKKFANTWVVRKNLKCASRKESKILRGQSVHSVHCKRISQQAQTRFVAEAATLLLFFDLLCCLDSANKYLKHCTVQNRSKNRWFCGIRNRISGIQNNLWNPHTNNETCVKLNWAVAEPATVSGSANCKSNPQIVRGICKL